MNWCCTFIFYIGTCTCIQYTLYMQKIHSLHTISNERWTPYKFYLIFATNLCPLAVFNIILIPLKNIKASQEKPRKKCKFWKKPKGNLFSLPVLHNAKRCDIKFYFFPSDKQNIINILFFGLSSKMQRLERICST